MPGEVCITTPYAHRADRCKHCMYRPITDRQLVASGETDSTLLIRSDSLYFMQLTHRGQVGPPGESPIPTDFVGIGGSYGALSAPHSDASAPYGVPRTH